jgi:hypothetical protein
VSNLFWGSKKGRRWRSLRRWIDVPRVRLDAQIRAILFRDEQEVSTDIQVLAVGNFDVSRPGAVLPGHVSVRGALPLLDLEMIPDLRCHFGPRFDAGAAAYAGLARRHENGIIAKQGGPVVGVVIVDVSTNFEFNCANACEISIVVSSMT